MAQERILVVDDEESIREIVSSMLNSANYQCRQASSGKEALARLDSGEEFDLMLTDLMMPEMDGSGLLERAKERYPDMPVVMVTAVHDIKVALDAIRDGAYDYLTKPFEREQLLATVRRALENRRLKMENRQYQVNLEALVAKRTEQLRSAITDLQRSYDITLQVLGEALDYKDRETEGHSKRVTAYTIAIARQMGVPKDQIEVIARGAFLHDIGKMAIPDSILNKPGKLTPDEISTMREHCYLGYKLVQKIPVLKEAAEIVYSHQERYDGTGYPRRLKGEEIPLGSRIFAVADTLDAIMSDRPYRPAQSFDAAREEILAWSGRQFDPDVVKAFMEIDEKVWRDLRHNIDAQQVSSVELPRIQTPTAQSSVAKATN
jgi:putative nucleotidyltransferase with HDIG domain